MFFFSILSSLSEQNSCVRTAGTALNVLHKLLLSLTHTAYFHGYVAFIVLQLQIQRSIAAEKRTKDLENGSRMMEEEEQEDANEKFSIAAADTFEEIMQANNLSAEAASAALKISLAEPR